MWSQIETSDYANHLSKQYCHVHSLYIFPEGSEEGHVSHYFKSNFKNFR